MPPAPVVPAASVLPVIEFTNSAGAPMTPAPEIPAVQEPEPVGALAFDAPLSLEAQSVEETTADALEEFSLELPAAEAAAADVDTSASMFATGADDIDFGAAMPEPVLDEELPAPAVATSSIDLDLPADLVAQLEAAEDPPANVLTLPVAAEVNLDALASVFADDAVIGHEALVREDAPPLIEPAFETAAVIEGVAAPAFAEQTDALPSYPVLQEETAPVASAWTPAAVEEMASAAPELAAASALDPVVPAPSLPSLSALDQATLSPEGAPGRVDLAGFAVGALSPEPAAPVAPASLSEMFAQPAAPPPSLAPEPVAAAVPPPVIVSRSPLPELERFLRKVQARRIQVAVGSVA
jgi:hypothetical protein